MKHPRATPIAPDYGYLKNSCLSKTLLIKNNLNREPSYFKDLFASDMDSYEQKKHVQLYRTI